MRDRSSVEMIRDRSLKRHLRARKGKAPRLSGKASDTMSSALSKTPPMLCRTLSMLNQGYRTLLDGL